MDADADALVVGAIDMHCHHGPDPHRVRSVDAAEAVREAEALGLGAVVLQSHAYTTGPVAILMQVTGSGGRGVGCGELVLRLRGGVPHTRRRRGRAPNRGEGGVAADVLLRLRPPQARA